MRFFALPLLLATLVAAHPAQDGSGQPAAWQPAPWPLPPPDYSTLVAGLQAQAQHAAHAQHAGAFASGFPAFRPPIATQVPGGVAAGATSSVAGGQAHQTAYLVPENPAAPNVDVTSRFSPSAQGTQGVSVSSFSSHSNVGGKQSSHRQASATVNDNGNITTYTVSD